MENKAIADRNDLFLGISLGFLAGYVDTLGFVALFGLFTSHVTGNFVLIGSELARPSHGVLIKFLAFPAFILSVAFTRLMILWLERTARPALFYTFLLQFVLLATFMLCGLLALPIISAEAPMVLTAGMIGAAAMGVQNAGSRLLLSRLTPTTMMTGNVTQLVIDLVDVLRGAAESGAGQRFVKFFWPIAAFGTGAICAAFAYAWIGFVALLLPLAILGRLILKARQIR